MKISRLKRLAYRLRKFKIIVDDKNAGYIKDNETLELDIGKGRHEIFFKYTVEKSKPISVSNEDQLEIHFRDDVWKLMLIVPVGVLCVFGVGALLASVLRNEIFYGIGVIVAVLSWCIIYFTKIAPNSITVNKKQK